MQRALLERQADHIEMVLASQKIPGRVFAMTGAPLLLRLPSPDVAHVLIAGHRRQRLGGRLRLIK